LNLQLQRQLCSKLERFSSEKNNFILNTRYAISCVVNFYNACIVTRDQRIGPYIRLLLHLRDAVVLEERVHQARNVGDAGNVDAGGRQDLAASLGSILSISLGRNSWEKLGIWVK
jgi:hypothetical protein